MHVGLCEDLNLLLEVRYLDQYSTRDLDLRCPLCKGELHYVKDFDLKAYSKGAFLRHNPGDKAFYCNIDKLGVNSKKIRKIEQIYLHKRRDKYKNYLLDIMQLSHRDIDIHECRDYSKWKEVITRALSEEKHRNIWIDTAINHYINCGLIRDMTNIYVHRLICKDIFDYVVYRNPPWILDYLIHQSLNKHKCRMTGSIMVASIIDLICSTNWIRNIKIFDKEGINKKKEDSKQVVLI